MPNQLAKGMNLVLKHEQVINDDPEEISTIIGKLRKENGNSKR
jgi:hypothetical protein